MYPQHCVVFGRAFYSDEKSLHSLTFETEEALSEERKKKSVIRGQQMLFYCAYPSNQPIFLLQTLLGTFFPLRTASLISHKIYVFLSLYYYLLISQM